MCASAGRRTGGTSYGYMVVGGQGEASVDGERTLAAGWRHTTSAGWQAGRHAAELWSRQPDVAGGRATWLAVLAVCDWNRTLVAAQNIFFDLHSTIFVQYLK